MYLTWYFRYKICTDMFNPTSIAAVIFGENNSPACSFCWFYVVPTDLSIAVQALTKCISFRETEETTEETPEETGGFDAEGFLLGVYQTAEQGVAFLSSILDLPNKLNASRPIKAQSTTLKPDISSPVENVQRRAPKNLKHPNQLW